MEHYLEKIVENTSGKESYQVIVNGNTTSLETRFNPPLQLQKSKLYEMALVNLETYYSFPNINTTNNVLRYSHDHGLTWIDLLIPTGSYDIKDINETIQQKMREKKHYDAVNGEHLISVEANDNTLGSTLQLANGYQVDFTPKTSLSNVLGFQHILYTNSYNESENPVNILSINSILVSNDIISGSYVNGQQQNVIYSFFPDAAPGYKIFECPRNLVYLRLNMDTIYKMNTKLTDQNGTQLNLRGETLTIRYHIREV